MVLPVGAVGKRQLRRRRQTIVVSPREGLISLLVGPPEHEPEEEDDDELEDVAEDHGREAEGVLGCLGGEVEVGTDLEEGEGDAERGQLWRRLRSKEGAEESD